MQFLLLFVIGFMSLLLIEKLEFPISFGSFLIVSVSYSIGGYYQARIEDKYKIQSK